METADQIRKLMIEGELEDSLRLATSFLRERDFSTYNECVQLQAMLGESGRKFRLNLIKMEDVEVTEGKVRFTMLEIVLKKIEQLSREPLPQSPAPVQEISRQETQKIAVNFIANVPANQAPAPAATPDLPSTRDKLSGEAHEAAEHLLNEFFKLLTSSEVENAAWRAAPFFHRSLLANGAIQPQFKQNNFYPAHRQVRSYKMPVHFSQIKSTNRTAIGSLRDRDEGEEFVYTLEKVNDSGGMPGMVRVFFPKNGGEPKITALSL
ncbi:MAG: hypothetical protein AAB316_11740 [Bacteroidota bacterium]